MYRYFFKRFLDIVLSGIAMIALLPVYLVLAIIVRISMGSPILFSQERIGKGEKPFKLYKFRSMTNARDKEGNLLPEEQRVTRAGALIRSSSLDELPELWAIFIGDMSFVGPRPLRMDDLPYFNESERARHSVRGGLIPPRQLVWQRSLQRMRNNLNMRCIMQTTLSLWLDLKVFFLTFSIIIKRMTNDYGNDFRPHLKEYRTNEIMK